MNIPNFGLLGRLLDRREPGVHFHGEIVSGFVGLIASIAKDRRHKCKDGEQFHRRQPSSLNPKMPHPRRDKDIPEG